MSNVVSYYCKICYPAGFLHPGILYNSMDSALTHLVGTHKVTVLRDAIDKIGTEI